MTLEESLEVKKSHPWDKVRVLHRNPDTFSENSEKCRKPVFCVAPSHPEKVIALISEDATKKTFRQVKEGEETAGRSREYI
jgi:hypothetical protein